MAPLPFAVDPGEQFRNAKPCSEKRTPESSIFHLTAGDLTSDRRFTWQPDQVTIFKNWVAFKGPNVMSADLTPLLRVLELDGYEDVLNYRGESVHRLILKKVRDKLSRTKRECPEQPKAYVAADIRSPQVNLKVLREPKYPDPTTWPREYEDRRDSFDKKGPRSSLPSDTQRRKPAASESQGRACNVPLQPPQSSNTPRPSQPVTTRGTTSARQPMQGATSRLTQNDRVLKYEFGSEAANDDEVEPRRPRAHSPPKFPTFNFQFEGLTTHHKTYPQPQPQPQPRSTRPSHHNKDVTKKNLQACMHKLREAMEELTMEISQLPSDIESAGLDTAAHDAGLEIDHLGNLVREYMMD
ncbi:hypothetical protein HD806DRAFT_538329 [Xylariaceae sp. AK1471]|nr:hypothetical protein HD806DRAFT_538329 [Xylariaceae sp. AK1471]